MNNLNTIHLSDDPERRIKLRAARELISGAKGNLTVKFEFEQPVENLGRIDFWSPPSNKKFNSHDSQYLILLGTEPYRLKYGNNYVGRFSDNDLVIDDGYVSRRHCCIVIHSDGRAEIFDTASKNGTYVNGQRIERKNLASNDEVRLAGSFHFSITLDELEPPIN